MALFGTIRDMNLFSSIADEVVSDIITQQIGYYKISLIDTKVNLYGESMKKKYIGPVLINCLIERGDFETPIKDQGLDRKRNVSFRFLRDHMIAANVYPEAGDVVMYNEVYYQVDNVNTNQQILGKDPAYAYSDGLENYGKNFSIILNCFYTSADKLGIVEQTPTN